MGFSGKNLEFFQNHQRPPNLPQNATEIAKFLKTFKIWGLFKKIDRFSEKNLDFFENR